MNGILNYAAPARCAKTRILGVISGCVAAIALAVPMIELSIAQLLSREFLKPGLHRTQVHLAATMVVASTVAIVTLSAAGLILAAAGIDRNDREQWWAPLAFLINTAALIAAILSSLR